MNLKKYLSINYFRFIIETRFLKRRTPLVLNINNSKIITTDALAAFWQFKEIFIDESYYFDTENEEPCVVDCGANIGMSTFYFKTLYPKAKIYSFEPNPKIFNLLKRNVGTFSNIILSSEACWIKNGEIEFFIGQDDGSSITNHTESVIKVKSINFNEFLNNFEQIDFLKIDIEGAEKLLIPTIESNLHKIKNLFIEFHCWKNEQLNLSIMCEILERNNFLFTIDRVNHDSKPIKNLKKNLSVQLNIFATKK